MRIPCYTPLEFWFKWNYYRAKRIAIRACRRSVSLVRPWVHTPDDGRGMRDVYLDGQKIERVFYADTRAGLIRAHHQPAKICPRREVIRSYKRYGDVRVVSLPEKVSGRWGG